MKALQPDVFHDRMGDTETIERFNSGGTIGQNTDRSGWGDGRDRGIPSRTVFGLQPTAFVGWERSSLLGQPM